MSRWWWKVCRRWARGWREWQPFRRSCYRAIGGAIAVIAPLVLRAVWLFVKVSILFGVAFFLLVIGVAVGTNRSTQMAKRPGPEGG